MNASAEASRNPSSTLTVESMEILQWLRDQGFRAEYNSRSDSIVIYLVRKA